MQRTLQPELLDTLPPDHPDALHNRRDLRLTNAVLGTHRWFVRTLPALLRSRERTIELGAGTGELGRALAQAGVVIDGLDRWPRPETWSATAAWHVGDLRSFGRYAEYHAIIGNLIFHQFSDQELAALGDILRRHARVIVASEPARQRRSQLLFRVFAALVGANHVSRHDGHVSIAAGFRGDELPRLLGLKADAWEVRCTTTLLGAYRMVAVRR